MCRLIVDILNARTAEDFEGIRNTEYSEEQQFEAYWEVDNKNIKYVSNPIKEIQELVSVQHNPWNVQYIENPDERIQMEAVKQAGFLIQYIAIPTERVQMMAIKDDVTNYQYIACPTDDVKKEVAKILQYQMEYSLAKYQKAQQMLNELGDLGIEDEEEVELPF